MKYENNQFRIIEIITLTSQIRCMTMDTWSEVAHSSQQGTQKHKPVPLS